MSSHDTPPEDDKTEMNSPATPPEDDQPETSSPATPPEDDQPATGPTEPLSSGDPLQAGPERPTEQQPPPPPPPPPRRLTRTEGDRMLGGVAGGLARYFSIDPIIVRIAFAVLAFAGGAGVFAYLAAWLLVPSDGAAAAPRTGTNRVLAITGGVVLAIAALAFLGPGLVFVGPPLLGFGLIAVVGVLLWNAAGGGEGGDGYRVARRLGLVLLLLVVAGVGFVAVVIGAAVGGGAVIAGLVIAVGVALVVGAFLGGARWLVIPALVLAVPLGLVAAAGIDVEGGVGDRDYHPTRVAELDRGYQLGIGELRLDLRDLDLPAGRTDVKIDIGVGNVEMLVPDDVCVASTVQIGAGYFQVFERDNGGLDIDWRTSPVEKLGVKRLIIDADVGIGAIQVVHNRNELFDEWDEERSGRFGDRFQSEDDLNPLRTNNACEQAA
jgi:phage shock protein PspC (stress-responsive transcriptional regulator)